MKNLIILFIVASAATNIFAQRARNGALGRDSMVVTQEQDLVASAALTAHSGSTNLHLTAAWRDKISSSVDAARAADIALGITAPVASDLSSHTNNGAVHLASGERARIAASIDGASASNAIRASVATEAYDRSTNITAYTAYMFGLEAGYRRAADAASSNYTQTVSNNLYVYASSALSNTASRVDALEAQTGVDTLATVAAHGNFAGTETISPLGVNAKRFGNGAGSSATGDDWFAGGVGAGESADGDYWTALGRGSGVQASGEGWSALGGYSGYMSRGDYWTALGFEAGAYSDWSNSAAIGIYAGYQAKGNGGLYVDVYTHEPPETHSPTNDAVYGINGQLNLGRTGALTNPAPNNLRGRWNINGSPVESSATKEIHADSYTNLLWRQIFSNGWCWLVAFTNTP